MITPANGSVGHANQTSLFTASPVVQLSLVLSQHVLVEPLQPRQLSATRPIVQAYMLWYTTELPGMV